MTTSIPIQLPAPAPLLTRGGWTAFIVALIAVCAVAPALNLLAPAGSAFHLSDYAVALVVPCRGESASVKSMLETTPNST